MEDNPFNRKLRDHENITFMVKMTAEMSTKHIDHATARTIAAQWDAGATSDMHSFVTTGRIGEGLEAEIEANFQEAKDPDDQQALAYLSAYAMGREDKDAQAGWSKLWITAPVEQTGGGDE
jgi:predicted deacylase